MESPKYRVYAKIIGYILPKSPEGLGDCFIVDMTEEEQNRRSFATLSVKNPESIVEMDYKSFLIPVRNTDSRIIKSSNVVYTDISHNSLGSVLGIAISRFDKLVVTLSLSASNWFEKKHNRFLFQPYDYQICKVYEIVDDIEKEIDENRIFFGGSVEQINLPTSNIFDADDQALMDKMVKSDLHVVNKSMGYFLGARRLLHQGFSLDKVTLDLAKSVETLTNIFTGKSFYKRLDAMAKAIGLPDSVKADIKKLWKKRSEEDVAHASLFDRRQSLPPQFPTPSRTDLQMNAFEIVSQAILKFFLFLHGIVEVRIRRKAEFGSMNEIVQINQSDLFVFNSGEKNRMKLTKITKKKLAEAFKKSPKDIKIIQNKFPNLLFKIKDYKRGDYRGTGMIRIFGRGDI